MPSHQIKEANVVLLPLLAQILTSLSFAFEAAQALTDSLTESTLLPQEIDPGSVLNLFA